MQFEYGLSGKWLELLKQIAPAVDAAREANLMLEMNLRNIFVHFPESFAEPAANVVLRCPLDEWPAFVVKMSLLAKLIELEASARFADEQTIVSEAKPQRDVVQLGILAYELLGGKRGGFAPLANVSEEGNEILRKCLTPDRSSFLVPNHRHFPLSDPRFRRAMSDRQQRLVRFLDQRRDHRRRGPPALSFDRRP